MKTYILDVEVEQDEDGRWSAEVPYFPGCAAWGYTREEALTMLQESAQALIEVMLEDGDPLPNGLQACEIASGSEPLFSEKAVTVSI